MKHPFPQGLLNIASSLPETRLIFPLVTINQGIFSFGSNPFLGVNVLTPDNLLCYLCFTIFML